MGHEWHPMTFACDRCSWVPIYGVLFRDVNGMKYGDNMRRPGEGYRVQHRTVVFDQPVVAGVIFDIILGNGSPWGIQQFVGDGIRKGFRVKP